MDKNIGLKLWMDGAKSQVDARRSHTCHFRYRMQPIALQIAVHQNQLARRQGQFAFFAIDFVLEAKAPTRSQAQGSNGGRVAQGGFIVAVPAHALAAIFIQIDQTRIEAVACMCFHQSFQGQHGLAPRQWLLERAAVIIGRIAIPSDFARGGDALAEQNHFIVLPWRVLQQGFKPSRCGL